MTPARWQQVDQLLEATLELPRGEREAFLTQSCGGDETLRLEVLSLLAGSDKAEDFLEAPPVDEMVDLFQRVESAFKPGQRIGPYRILSEIGRGGMGLVLLAVRDDDAYQKQVAIKLVSPGPLHTEVLRRFRRERQILADLEHPNIARLLDGGTTEQGWPYVVMEYVEGVPLTNYCHEHKLALTERLNLFLEVCAAVQYAHQRLIIHRDLKPANILVTNEGMVKLLDFGIAKLLEPERQQLSAHQTQTGMLLMTPEYASPEQMRGGAITTASDVYSLGVLLYELLTGQLPHQLRSSALPELIRAVCEDEPLPPSRLNAALRGDLEVIALAALSKDLTSRYSSVEQLSADLCRHLEGLPIMARKASLAYRSEKFIRRNRLGVLAVALVFLTLLGGIVTTARQARIAERERGRAEQQERSNRRLLYASNMNLAQQDWETVNLGRMTELLNSHVPKSGEEDVRGFEWYYLWRLCHSDLFTLQHATGVTSVAFSPDGKRLATGIDGAAKLWDAVTGQELLSLKGHVLSVAFSPDGKRLAIGSVGRALLWDAATGQELLSLKGVGDRVKSCGNCFTAPC